MPCIVVGYDDSPGSQAALEVAASLAAEHGDDLVIGFGIEPPGTVGDEGRAHRDALRDAGEKAAKHAVELVRDRDVETRVELVEKRPVDALLALAEQHDARFIVVGTYGESPLKGAILGSTPHKLLHLSDTPVVVVPAA
jgi:nucleotide-binding universal stress UspA family protein